MALNTSDTITFEEFIACTGAMTEWAMSFDTKDWNRLRSCIAPSIRIVYKFLDKHWDALPAEEYVAMTAKLFGDQRLATQHLFGSSRWEKTSDDSITGYHQIRVAQQKYKDSSRKELDIKGHAHGENIHWYKKVNGVWKFAGCQPEIWWGEYNLEKFFASLSLTA
ncbi:Scytalone dehydratase [Atractiella rhizophila]|nr:Scytalone dehydratase [Atractiella rhizophila]